jgi:hypothetical protein
MSYRRGQCRQQTKFRDADEKYRLSIWQAGLNWSTFVVATGKSWLVGTTGAWREQASTASLPGPGADGTQ